MFLSMQTTCAACNPSMAIQQKKVATVGKKRVAISKKRVVKSKKRTYRKASARKYSHRELNAIMRILERKFLSEDKTPALRNVVGFGMGSNSIDVALRWNTKEKQQEFRRQIYNSPAIRFEGKLAPIIDNREGVSTYQGLSLKAEKPSYPLGTTEIRFTITNHSGEEFVYGDAYSITAQGADGNLSDAVTGGISPQQNYSRQSVGTPSSMQEADVKQNEGEHNTYPQHLAKGQTQQSNGSNANGYKANSYHNGNQ